MTVGPMEGTLLAIARELHDLGGYAVTRLTSPVAAGDVVWPVESTLLFPDSGTVVARGTRYTFASKTPATLEGVQHTDGVTTFPGAKIALPAESSVLDYSRATTAMDLLRRAMLVDFAEGSDLSVVGSNLGVPRFPGVPNDAVYREIIKALAYNPRGTVYGIELLLDAFLGTGNWAIFEDLVSEPNKVFIQLLGAAAANTIFLGKAYLNQDVLRPEDSATQVTIPGPPPIETVYSATFKDEDHLSDFRNQLPSAETLVEYPGDPGTILWGYIGPAEGSDVTQVPGLHISIDDSSAVDVAQYRHDARVQPESDASMEMVTAIDAGSFPIASGASDWTQWGGIIEDGERAVGWGVLDSGFGLYTPQLIDPSTGMSIGPTLGGLTTGGIFYSIELRKVGRDRVELYVDGNLRESQPYSSFPTSTKTRFVFGANNASTTIVGLVKQVGYFSRTSTDYWAARGSDGEAFPAATSDKTIEDVVAAMFVSGDVGKRLIVSGSTAATGSSMTGGAATVGRNNGIFEIATFASANRVTVQGPARSGAFVQSGTPTIFFANDDQAFQFPDDLGKEVVVSGAANPVNNGTFPITDLISEADGVTSLLAGDTPHPEKTGIAVMASATFVTETDLAWRLDPVFINETGLDVELSDAGTEAGGVLTLRQALPSLGGGVIRILRIRYTDVLSAQILEDISVKNVFVGPGADDFSHYPFYLSDPLGVLRAYLDIITAAGVIPELLE